MLVKILGVADVILGLILIFFGAGINIPNEILIIISLVLIAKSLLGFFKDFASWIDFIAGIMLILAIWFPILNLVVIIFGIFIIQKGVFSFL